MKQRSIPPTLSHIYSFPQRNKKREGLEWKESIYVEMSKKKKGGGTVIQCQMGYGKVIVCKILLMNQHIV